MERLKIKTFNRLIILGPAPHKGKRRLPHLLCLCSCGKQTTVSKQNLVKGHTRSCGCLRDEKISNLSRKAPGAASFAHLYNAIKQSARTRSLCFDLSKEQHEELIKEDCFHCGEPAKPFNAHITRKTKNIKTFNDGWINANGIDRLDNRLGYIYENCVPACAVCNYGKQDSSEEEFYAHCAKVAAFQIKKAA